MRIDKLITSYKEEKKNIESKKAQVIIYTPGNRPEVDRDPGDNRVLFFIPDNGRD